MSTGASRSGTVAAPDASPTDSHERIVQVARRLFGERGYTAVTIRAVASEAGVSPALVMKVAGSKEGLFALATPTEPTPLAPDVPLDGLGEQLVRRMIQRREDDAAEPWLRALYLLLDAPDPEGVRAEFRERVSARFTHRETSPRESTRHVDELACLLVGLAAGLRTFRLFDPRSTDLDAVVAEYGAIVQRVLDRLE